MKKINLTVGTSIDSMGGIATVLNVYRDVGFFEKWNVKLISTHSEKRGFGGINLLVIYILALIKIVFYYLFYDVGLVHIHMASRGSYLRKSLLVRLVKLLGGKVILHLHGAEFKEFYSEESSKIKQSSIRKTFEISDAVIVLSTQWITWAKDTLDKSNHVQVLYNAVPPIRIDRSNVEIGLVAFLGRVGKRKGVDDLLLAFKTVIKAYPNAQLLIGGDGDIALYQKEVEKLGLTKSVKFLGWLAGKDKEALLSKADVYCLPSYNEGFPMGVLEAMSAGVPVVSSKAGGIPDAIEDKENGLLIDAGDIVALSGAIIGLINDRGLNNNFSKSAKNKFDLFFSTEAIMPKLDIIYRDVLKLNADNLMK